MSFYSGVLPVRNKAENEKLEANIKEAEEQLEKAKEVLQRKEESSKQRGRCRRPKQDVGKPKRLKIKNAAEELEAAQECLKATPEASTSVHWICTLLPCMSSATFMLTCQRACIVVPHSGLQYTAMPDNSKFTFCVNMGS